MAFEPKVMANVYRRFLGPLAMPIRLLKNGGVGFVEFPEITAFVSKYIEEDLLDGGSIQMGDLKVIILVEDIPSEFTKMDISDRIVIKNRYYAIINWDAYTRKMGEEGIAIEVAVRGGGVYLQREFFNIISEIDEDLITEDDNFGMITE